MRQDHKKALKCMVFAQSFVESLDDFGGTTAYRQQLKLKGAAFVKEVDKFLNHTYKNGSTDTSLINLIEGMQIAIDKVIDEDVTVID